MRTGITRSLVFPPAGEPRKEPRPPSILETFANALRDVELARKILFDLVASEDRHGDLQVCLSAARRLESALQALIEAEETR